MPDERAQHDLVLPLGVHAHILDATKGNVNVYVGPMKQPLSPQQDHPVIRNGIGRFDQVTMERAIMNNVVATKGEYIVLRNPAKDGKHPKLGSMSTPDPDNILVGETVNIPGPTAFPLWPGQVAEVVPGHHLKSNQFLLVRVYDEEAAKENWKKSTLKFVDVKDPAKSPDAEQTSTDKPAEAKVADIDPANLVMGQQLIIKGTEVSFYIPPTGIEVLKDDVNKSYVREALTLERLEYCLLVDEDGNKRYVRGPEVVFPTPTESFKVNDEQERKSRAYELNETSGIHIKVIAPYADQFGKTHDEGDELFVTGRHTTAEGSEEETSIYFPRVEHAILKYGGRTRYHAIAIAPGEARYVMDRLTGIPRLEEGPSMFLPDPRREVIVRRILSDLEVETYFPGNEKAKAHNRTLRASHEAEVTAAISGMPSAGAATRTGHMSNAVMASMSEYGDTSASRSGDVINRGVKYTPPRTITLDNKFEGAVVVRPWTGYSVQVVNGAGDRRIVMGPKNVTLSFDEHLEMFSLSTGTPKTADQTLRTVYLRIANNNVSDVIVVKTLDLVDVRIKIKYLANFMVEKKDSWFSVDNYVQNMVDRFRSLIGSHCRTIAVRDLYTNAAAILAELILKTDRSGYSFEENGLKVYGIDVLEVTVTEPKIAEAMRTLQHDRITNILEIERLASNLEKSQKQQETIRADAIANHETSAKQHELRTLMEKLQADLKRTQANLEIELSQTKADAKERLEEALLVAAQVEDQRKTLDFNQDKTSEEAALDRRVRELVAEANADVSRAGAISPQLVGALVALAQTGSLGLVAKHLGELSIVRQQSLGGVFESMFKGTPLEGFMDNLKQLGTGALVSK